MRMKSRPDRPCPRKVNEQSIQDDDEHEWLPSRAVDHFVARLLKILVKPNGFVQPGNLAQESDVRLTMRQGDPTSHLFQVLKKHDQGSDARRVHELDVFQIQHEENSSVITHSRCQLLHQVICFQTRELFGRDRDPHEIVCLLDLKVADLHMRLVIGQPGRHLAQDGQASIGKRNRHQYNPDNPWPRHKRLLA